MGLFIAIIVLLVVAVVAVLIGALFKSSLKAGRKEAAASSRLPAVSPEDAEKLAGARRQLASARQLALRVRDDDVRQRAAEVLDGADRLLATLKAQPEEIRRAKQFFGYYLPTVVTVLEKYLELEGSDMDISAQKTTVLAYLEDTARAFQASREGMFADERIDVEVEAQAMQMALARDGLI